MDTIVQIPLNTMLADLDESLRTLLKRELGGHGFDGVEVAFEAPTKDWSAGLSQPTVNLFLYDLREAADLRAVEWQPQRDEPGRIRNYRPPLRIDASYAATAWTRAVEDEHRLLSQLLAILYAFPQLPGDVLNGRLGPNGTGSKQPFPLVTRVAQARSDGGADFWSAIGGVYKASIDFVVTRLRPSPARASSAAPRCARRRCAWRPARTGSRRSSRAIASAARCADEEGAPVAGGLGRAADERLVDLERRRRALPLRPDPGRHATRASPGPRTDGRAKASSSCPARASTSSSALRGSAAGDQWGSASCPIGWPSRSIAALAPRRIMPACPRRPTPGRASCSVISSRWSASA